MRGDKLWESVRSLLLSNISQGYSKLLDHNYCYIEPSPHTYPFQWWWDSCFHVFILVKLKEFELAKKNMLSLFAMQEKNGFSGHMVFWKSPFPTNMADILQARPTLNQIRPHTSALIQPSFVAQAVERIVKASGDKEFLQTMLPKLKRYFNWLAENRDFEGDGLISIITPFESGMDWKASYDEVLGFYGKANIKLFWKVRLVDLRNFINRYDLKKIYNQNYFIVKDVLVNTTYSLDLKALARLCKEVGDEEWEVFEERSKKTAQKIVEVMYDSENQAFFDVYGKENKKLKTLTPTIFFPMALPEVSKKICEDIIERHLLNKEEFNLNYPIPSVAKNEPGFDPNESLYIWRGPSWVIFNWFLYHCLKSKGWEKQALKLKDVVKNLIEKSGFREYYNPFTGEGYGAKDFTWSGLIIDMD